jgi:hypothetical protein
MKVEGDLGWREDYDGMAGGDLDWKFDLLESDGLE